MESGKNCHVDAGIPVRKLAVVVLPQKPEGEWRFSEGTEPPSYSRLTQINKSNLRELQITWEWETGNELMPQLLTSATVSRTLG